MRSTIILMIALSFASCGHDSSSPNPYVPGPWSPVNGEMNLAILLVDYETYELRGGHVSHYYPCVGGEDAGLPFESYWVPPIDFGSITFVYAAVGDTVFDATIIWSGSGHIYYPDTFFEPDTFSIEHTRIELPQAVEYFDYSGQPSTPDQDTLERTQSVWDTVNNIDILHAYAKEPYKVGFFAYTPSVGIGNPSEWRWVVFVFRGC